ncbi:hypothetical protein BU26DRAFT_131681 [Trematosphaeria pertusa]|uniref:CFEM domain-containing protein n=1 Tax=Trematosphaeria pertusa TaxID=390896 RepID=A0A6A6HZF9_9PLEO|nr:uncharacterized protein BU26DRAFT_131681 [Trematosphaeria pertusa]KAF2242730.1 hypothetical protein BU26DRAFT_131681 [Trematosphaeria pertusa]
MRHCFGTDYGGCNQVDIGCICRNTQRIADLSCCVFQTCNQSDQDLTITLAHNLCKANGVDVPTSASCASTAASTSAPTASASGSSASGSAASVTSTPSGSAAGASGAGSTGAGVPMATAGPALGVGMAMAGLLAAL